MLKYCLWETILTYNVFALTGSSILLKTQNSLINIHDCKDLKLDRLYINNLQ